MEQTVPMMMGERPVHIDTSGALSSLRGEAWVGRVGSEVEKREQSGKTAQRRWPWSKEA